MKTFLIIDANALVHRSYHALPKFTAKDGRPTGALYGLASILIKFFRESPPDYIVAAFDRPEPSFREVLSKTYKAHRPEPEPALVSQIVEAYNLFKSFGIKTVDAPGFEADDLIGSLVEKFRKEKDLRIIILTGDLDSLQLVQDKKIVSQILRTGISESVVYDEDGVFTRFGLKPEQLPDYKGLVGDASDNISGIAGIGPKTALKLLQKYKNLGSLYEEISKKNAKTDELSVDLKEKLLKYREQAMFSRRLAEIARDAPLGVEKLEEMKHDKNFVKPASDYLMQFGFKSLIKRMEEGGGKKAKQGKLL